MIRETVTFRETNKTHILGDGEFFTTPAPPSLGNERRISINKLIAPEFGQQGLTTHTRKYIGFERPFRFAFRQPRELLFLSTTTRRWLRLHFNINSVILPTAMFDRHDTKFQFFNIKN